MNLAFTGLRLVRQAAGGLLDEEDTELLDAHSSKRSTQTRTPGIIRIHRLRAIRAGRFTHVDAHLVVPEYWTIERAHEVTDAFERRVIDACKIDGEIEFHSDPCRRAFCSACDVARLSDPRRRRSSTRPPLTIDEARLTDDSFWAARV